jgi:hypothetical protein
LKCLEDGDVLTGGDNFLVMTDESVQLDFFSDPEVRVERQHDRRSKHAINTSLGRQMTEVLYPVRNDMEVPEIIPEELISDYATRNQDNFPLFNDFTDHAHISPNDKSIFDYITAGNKKVHEAYRAEKMVRGLMAVMGLPVTTQVPQLDRNAMIRQTNYVSDNLQRYALTDRNVARLWRASLDTVRRQTLKGESLDEASAINSISAVLDFGRSIVQQASESGIIRDRELGLNIVYMFQSEDKDAQIRLLKTNLPLLRLVQLNAKAADILCTKQFNATVKYFAKPENGGKGHRVTKAEIEASIQNREEIKRIRSLSR